MNTEKVSGRMLFFRYCFPCAEFRRSMQKINDSDMSSLMAHTSNGVEPDLALLERCFPDAIADYAKWACVSHRDISQVMTADMVQMYWRQEHKKDDPKCQVKFGQVVDMDSKSIQVLSSGETVRCFNLYQLPIKFGHFVYIHQSVIAEFEEK